MQELIASKNLFFILTIQDTTISTCKHFIIGIYRKVSKNNNIDLFAKFPSIFNHICVHNRYHRCMFELPLHPTSQSSGSQQYISLTPVTISPFSRWDEITNEKVKPSDRPVVLNRASSTNTTNPFGSTFCYGYQVQIRHIV